MKRYQSSSKPPVVENMPAPASQPLAKRAFTEPAPSASPKMQAQLETTEKLGHKVADIDMTPRVNAPPIQPKLTIGAVGSQQIQAQFDERGELKQSDKLIADALNVRYKPKSPIRPYQIKNLRDNRDKTYSSMEEVASALLLVQSPTPIVAAPKPPVGIKSTKPSPSVGVKPTEPKSSVGVKSMEPEPSVGVKLTEPEPSIGVKSPEPEPIPVPETTPPESTGVTTASTPERVKRAIAGVTDLSKANIMKALVQEYGKTNALVEASKHPEFASALLEAIQSKQSKGWQQATALKPVPKSSQKGLPGDPKDWTIRHYTNKATVTLGQGAKGSRPVIKVEPPPFQELLSMVTLAAMQEVGMQNYPLNLGQNQELYTNSSSQTSGHTTELDWTNIGNIGDTFYALFYKGKSATGQVPAFITDALYYAEWSLTDFGEGWASSDWLATASESKKEKGRTPTGKAIEGSIDKVIAEQLDMLKIATRNMKDEQTISQETGSKLRANFENFEVKKHGSMKLQPEGWKVANPGKIEEIKKKVL